MVSIVIVGNGAAGNRAAEIIRGYDPGAAITMVAREESPEYSACALPDYLSGWISREQLFIKQWSDYRKSNINIISGVNVARIDAGQKLLVTEQGDISYDRLILATGSRTFLPPVPGHDLPGNFAVKTVTDIDAIMAHRPQRAVVVGSGNIGVEMAASLKVRGCQVTLVEMRGQILPRIFDPESAGRIRGMLTTHGIRVFTGEELMAVSGCDRVEKVSTSQQVIACDTVVWAAGMKPEVEIASQAGIEIGELGAIKVDPFLQTNRPGIYACGDCIEAVDMLTGMPAQRMLWPNAKRQGEVAGLNCIGCQVAYEGAISLVTSEVFGVPVASMGLTAAALTGQPVQVVEGECQGSHWRLLLVDDRIMGMQAIGITAGLGAVMAMMKNRVLITDFRKIVSDPELAQRAAWYLPAGRFLNAG
ncbi:MAG: FAD-dependent oxidoreductase [Syntrophomonadaceae bacterium]